MTAYVVMMDLCRDLTIDGKTKYETEIGTALLELFDSYDKAVAYVEGILKRFDVWFASHPGTDSDGKQRASYYVDMEEDVPTDPKWYAFVNDFLDIDAKKNDLIRFFITPRKVR